MAEENEKAAQKEPTATEVAERLEAAKARQGSLGEFLEGLLGTPAVFWSHAHTPFSFPAGRFITLVDLEGKQHRLFFTFSNLEVSPAANTVELALAGDDPVSGPVPAATRKQRDISTRETDPAEEATSKVLVNLALAEVERSREIMQRDDVEIQRLKEETRLILNKLQAA